MRRRPAWMILRAAACAACAAFLSGCLWVMRVPVCCRASYSDDGCCTNRTWVVPMREAGIRGVCPTVRARVRLTRKMSARREADRAAVRNGALKGGDLYNARLRLRYGWAGYVAVWLGLPVDLCVDALLLPADAFDGKEL